MKMIKSMLMILLFCGAVGMGGQDSDAKGACGSGVEGEQQVEADQEKN